MHGLNNTIHKGSRRNPTINRSTLLDVILCYFLTLLTAYEVINSPFSDHSMVISAFNFEKQYKNKKLKVQDAPIQLK